MEIEEKIYQSLLNDPEVSRIVGKKIYYLIAPPRDEAPVPLLVYSAPMNIGGDLSGLNNIENGRIEIDAMAINREDLFKLRRAVINAIDKGLMPLSSNRDGGLYDPVERLYIETIFFMIQHNTQ